MIKKCYRKLSESFILKLIPAPAYPNPAMSSLLPVTGSIMMIPCTGGCPISFAVHIAIAASYPFSFYPNIIRIWSGWPYIYRRRGPGVHNHI